MQITDVNLLRALKERDDSDTTYYQTTYPVRKEAVLQTYFTFLGETLSKEDEAKIREYYEPRKNRVNPIDYVFVGNRVLQCNLAKPKFLIIMCLSSPDNILQRNTIRMTWGQMVRYAKRTMKIVFIVGKSNDPSIDSAVEKEHTMYGDIIHITSMDTYEDLTTKVMMGLKWAATFCPTVQFLMKVDDDCFVHVDNAISMLEKLTVPKHGVILGNANFNHFVDRNETKWMMTEEEFPFKKMPLYLNGQTYVISGNILGRLFEAGEHMPYIKIEDGFVTGILRTVIGASIVPTRGFPRYVMAPASPCSFHNDRRISATNNSPAQMKKIWDGLQIKMTDCYGCQSVTC
ncbi:hypothetical protein ACF0H5_007218 [Mactra antiquata]